MYLKNVSYMLCYIRREYMYLDILHVLYTYPKESKIHLEYISDTSGYMYLARFLGVTLDTYQDTSGYVYLGRFFTIHQDTPRYKSRYMRNTSKIHDGIHVSQMYLERYVSEMQDACGIHAGYMYLQG